MASNLIGLAGWYFLPNLVTGYVQTALYTILIRAGDPKPAPGSPRFVRDRRNIQTAVILLYLFYQLYDADYQLYKNGDFYSLLGVTHDVNDKTLQSRFRRLTVQYHPDKASAADKPAMEAIYISIKSARDTLADPAKRFAYDRFGPAILGWQKCTLIRDFILIGLQNIVVYYIGSGAALAIVSILGYLRSGMFWRYLVMGALLVIELHTITRPTFPAWLANVINPVLVTTGIRTPYLPYQMMILLRKFTITLFIAMSQLGPLFRDPQQVASENGPGVSAQQLDRVDALTGAADAEVTRLMGLELMPFAVDQKATRDLRTSLKEWLVQNTIRNDPEVKDAMNRVLDRRRREGHLQNGAGRS